jgi:hypothetical protein
MTFTPDVDAAKPQSSLTDDDELPVAEEPVILASEDQPLSPSELQRDALEPVAPLLSVETAHLAREALRDPESDSPPDSNDISFLRQKNAQATRPSLLWHATWIFLSVTLVLGLAGQVALHERDQIAAWRPDLNPRLQTICDWLNCQISPWRKIESIVIDSSAFTRIHGDSYRLSLTLKNMAAVPVALPALELTLTDTLDQPVIRRVLALSEVDSEPEFIAASSERSVSLNVAVNPVGGAGRFAGYRLLAFYP